MTLVATHLVITGKVQRVFYRDWTVKTAMSLGLVGWVRNRMDGNVEALVQGEQDAVARFIALAGEVPPAARVDQVRTGPADIADLSGFEQRATV